MFLRRLLIIALLPCFSVFAQQECMRPAAPASIPDGTTAGEDAMIEASQMVKKFVAEGEAYVACMQPQIDAAKARVAETEGTDQHEPASILLVKLIKQHDSMVEQMRATASAFNMSVRAYNSQE